MYAETNVTSCECLKRVIRKFVNAASRSKWRLRVLRLVSYRRKSCYFLIHSMHALDTLSLLLWTYFILVPLTPPPPYSRTQIYWLASFPTSSHWCLTIVYAVSIVSWERSTHLTHHHKTLSSISQNTLQLCISLVCTLSTYSRKKIWNRLSPCSLRLLKRTLVALRGHRCLICSCTYSCITWPANKSWRWPLYRSCWDSFGCLVVR